MSVQALKGFKDILPDEVTIWQNIESTARHIFHRFGFAEIKVPILEKTELFKRSIGETTDIVEKEMYTFADRNGSSLTMRPEGTASVLRAFIEHNLHTLQPLQKLYTIGPMFRHERPQKGRLRQFHQMSVEAVGVDYPRLDAEVMAMAVMILKEIGVTASLEINSLGCKECRPRFNRALVDFLADCSEPLCGDCERRRQTNPLRILDCKVESCRRQYVAAPAILDHLCPDCVSHFQAVKDGLDLLAVPYRVNAAMVRGLDYYTRTTFELVTTMLGAQSAVGAGGRYDGLLRQLDGPDLPGIGFAMGMERLVLLLQQQEGAGLPTAGLDLFIAALDTEAQNLAYALQHRLRSQGLRVGMDLAGRSLKSQMKQADRSLASYTLILGAEEMKQRLGTLRDMATKAQIPVPLGDDLEVCSAAIRKQLTAE